MPGVVATSGRFADLRRRAPLTVLLLVATWLLVWGYREHWAVWLATPTLAIWPPPASPPHSVPSPEQWLHAYLSLASNIAVLVALPRLVWHIWSVVAPAPARIVQLPFRAFLLWGYVGGALAVWATRSLLLPMSAAQHLASASAHGLVMTFSLTWFSEWATRSLLAVSLGWVLAVLVFLVLRSRWELPGWRAPACYCCSLALVLGTVPAGFMVDAFWLSVFVASLVGLQVLAIAAGLLTAQRGQPQT